jgi:uncharacterized protein (TIGR02147 family)
MKTALDLYQYTDAPTFLADAFADAKKRNPRWSLRSWAKKLGLAGPSGLGMVLNGQRNVGEALAAKLALYFGFSPAEREYFLNLVHLGTRGAPAPLIAQLQSTAARRGGRSGRAGHASEDAAESSAPSEELRIASSWFFYAIREMSLLAGFQATADWIAPRLRHPVPSSEIAAALASLRRQGLLAPDLRGRLRPATGKIAARAGMGDALSRKFHSEVLELAEHSLWNDAIDSRGFFSSTFTISKASLPAAREAIRKFRAEFERAFERDGGDTTVQLGVQLFSVADGEPK